MYCSKCGSVMNAQDKFCPSCGAKVEENKQFLVENGQSVPTPTTSSNYTQPPIQRSGFSNGEYQQTSGYYGKIRKNANGTNNIILAVFLLIVLGGGIFIAMPHMKNFINNFGNKKSKESFLTENKKQDTFNDVLVCTGYGDSIDMQMTFNYEKNQLQKIKYSFIYDTRNGEDFNVNMSCKDGDCTSKNGISTEEQNRLMLYMMFNMEEVICNKTGVVCLKEDGDPYYKSAFTFTPSLLNDSNLKTSYTNEFLRMSKQEIKQEMATMYGLACEWKE